MRAADILSIETNSTPEAFWAQVAERAAAWLAGQGVPRRDAIVVLPFLQLLEPARRGFAALGGWQPRIETTATLAAALGPPPVAPIGSLSGREVHDALVASQMLRRVPALAQWERDDARAFHQAVAATVDSARQLARGAQERAPPEREAYWSHASTLIAASARGPGALEQLLARLALEWARQAPAPASDLLFGLVPGAWVWVDAGGADALMASVSAHARCPALRIDADPAADGVLDGVARLPAPRLVATEGMEDEALAVAAEVIEALNARHRPVALIALDRALLRRVRALLERQGVRLADETGWALSTTRAGARVLATLRAGAERASHDERLEWLKSIPPAYLSSGAVDQLELRWRNGRTTAGTDGDAVARLLDWMEHELAPLRAVPRQDLGAWLQALHGVLEGCGLMATLATDAAGQQVLKALQLDAPSGQDQTLMVALHGERVDLDGFAGWVDRTLEAATYVPGAAAGADVVLTPLARSILRPFAAAVVGGADERQLWAMPRSAGLLGDGVAGALGLDTAAQVQARERVALAHLLRIPNVTLIHRKRDEQGPVAASAALAALAIARSRAGQPPIAQALARTALMAAPATPIHRPAPSAAQVLPDQLSATALDSLRSCPYRFFAHSVLRLRDADELAEGLDKREYGIWLHEVLDRFHRRRHDGAAGDAATLHALADEVGAELGYPPHRLLPFRTSFDLLVPVYLDWLERRERGGLRWADGEIALERAVPALGGTRLVGRIDRMDRGDADGAGRPRVSLLDYKTGSLDGLKSKLRNPYEDTQLAFYALLMQADIAADVAFDAAYLAMEDKAAPKEVPHPRVAETARVLLEGLVRDWQRLRDGAGLPALGEPPTCDWCDARGLCRRDHWSPTADAATADNPSGGAGR